MPLPSRQRKKGKTCYDGEINRFAPQNKIITEELNEHEEDEEEAFQDELDLNEIRNIINPTVVLQYKEGAEKYIRFAILVYNI